MKQRVKIAWVIEFGGGRTVRRANGRLMHNVWSPIGAYSTRKGAEEYYAGHASSGLYRIRKYTRPV